MREHGQATTEYVLIVAVSVSLALVVIKQFVVPTFSALQSKLGSKIDSQLSGGNLYHFRVR